MTESCLLAPIKSVTAVIGLSETPQPYVTARAVRNAARRIALTGDEKNETDQTTGKEWIFFDGGMGTILQEHGLKAGELPETWNLSHPDEIIALNRSYFEAGCDVVNTNTFGCKCPQISG